MEVDHNELNCSEDSISTDLMASSSYSDIHNRKALDSLSDILLKEKDGVPLDHNRRLFSN